MNFILLDCFDYHFLANAYFISFICFILFLSILFSFLDIRRNLFYLKLLHYCLIIGIIIEIILLLLVYLNDMHNSESGVINFVCIMICVILLCIVISMWDYFYFENYMSYEISILFLLCVEGMFVMLTSNDLFYIYLGIELQSLSLYILASIKKYSNLSIEAGLKYFILGSFASCILLYGISLIYIFLGTLSLEHISFLLGVMTLPGVDNINLGVVFGFIFLLTGLLFKLGIAPFHVWIADVYEGSPMIITYFFSVLPKIPVLILLMKIYFLDFICLDSVYIFIHSFSDLFIILILLCSLLSILIGSVGALYQVTIKRLLAYSAIANMGYILLGLCTAYSVFQFITFYYLLIYLLISINFFSIILVIRRYPSRLKLRNLIDFVSISQSNFLLSALSALCLLSLAGIPPLAGFFGKFFIFCSLISKGYYLIALYGVLISVLTCVYYLS